MPVHADGNHCPMPDAGVTVQDMDCCNDPLTAAETGQLCKTEVVCVTVGVSLPSPSNESEIAQSSDLVLSFVSLSPPTLQLATIWRPPALI